MHICFFSGDITNKGGTEKISLTVAEILKNIYKDKARISFVSIVHKKAEPSFKIPEGVSAFAFRKKPVGNPLQYFGVINSLCKYIRREKVDVLIDIDSVLDVLSIPAKLLTGVKVIAWDHFDFDEDLGSSYRHWIRKITLKRADAIVAITENSKQRYDEAKGKHTPVYLIRNPIYSPEAVAPYSTREKVIISVGWLIPVKGFDMAIEIAKKALLGTDWRWIIVGEGEQKEILAESIKKAELSDKMELIGYTDNISRLYNTAAIYALTSRSEGLPTVLLEAKQHRLPIVCFDIGAGVREITENGKSALYSTPFNTDEFTANLKKLMESRELCESFSENAEKGLESFSPDGIGRLWQELISSLIDKK